MCWARSLQSIDLCQNYFICEEPLTRAFDGYCHIFTSNVFGLWIFDHEARRCDADIWRKIQSCMICVPENRSIEAVKSSHHDEPVSVLTGYLQQNPHQLGFFGYHEAEHIRRKFYSVPADHQVTGIFATLTCKTSKRGSVWKCSIVSWTTVPSSDQMFQKHLWLLS